MALKSLLSVDFVDSDGKPTPGLVSTSSPDFAALRVDEQAAIFDAKLFKHIDFVFFRRFSDGRSSQVSAYVVDNSDERLDEKELGELHRQIWLYGMTPLLYVGWPTRIDILTCARGPDFWKDEEQACQYSPAHRWELVAVRTAAEIKQELHRFSAWRLADGTFWDEPNNKGLSDYRKAAHQLLIQAVVEADDALDGENRPVLRRLLLLTVLIKYLEDRRVFPRDWFGRFHKGARSFRDVLRGGDPASVYALLQCLERKFNGDVFVLPQNGEERLTHETLNWFADLVEAKTLNRQRYLWTQFSFEHLPVEIVSHLYQRFVQGGHGAVYTPPFLASLLLDQAMPYDGLTGLERVLDPACGSGVFLVGAFRRLVNIWRSAHNWQRPEVSMLKELVKRSIHGVEIDTTAIDLTAFSLSLAICDALQPDVIWRGLKFDPLRGSNLFERDFFGLLLDSGKGKPPIFDEGFDVVIGNPPFESKLSFEGTEVNRMARRHDSGRGKLPDNQVAYLFLEQALSLLRAGGRACLIQPSGLLYNRKTEAFRTAILRKYTIDTILDFTSIRNLYKADPKTIAVLGHSGAPADGHWIKHWSFRRTVSVHQRICFELDHYDRHRISQEEAETDPYVWRANLLGGGRLRDISRRLRSMRTLAEYVKQKEWEYGEGFNAGEKGKRTPAPFLTNKPFLPSDAFTDSGIDETKIGTVEVTHFDAPRTEVRFSSPLVLIKEGASLPVAFWDNGFLAYGHIIVGIHAPESEASELRQVYKTFHDNHETYRFACALNGTVSLVGRATGTRKQDIDILPYPSNPKDLSFSFWEMALCRDVLDHMTKYVRLGQNSTLLKNRAEMRDMQDYSSMFIRMLGSVYDNLKASDPIFFNGLTCQPFYFGERPDLSWPDEQSEEELRGLIYDDEKHGCLRTIRVLRLYSENVLLLVKPDRLRYWIPSTAIRDADETLLDLHRQGY